MSQNIACAIVMVKDDYEFMKIWVSHYEQLLEGRQHLIVISHGGDSEISHICNGCSIVHLPYSPDGASFEVHRRRLIRNMVDGLLTYYRNVIIVDSDEILTLDPRTKTTFLDRLAQISDDVIFHNALGFEIIHDSKNELPPLDFDKPILSQRQYGRVSSRFCKPVIHRKPNLRMTAHRVPKHPFNICPEFILFHLKAFDTQIFNSVQQRRFLTAQDYESEPHLQMWRSKEVAEQYFFTLFEKDADVQTFEPRDYDWLGPRIDRGVHRRGRVVGLTYGPFKVPDFMESLF